MTTSTEKNKKQDTKLESEGAEFLVLGLLLVEGVSAYKAYINFPGYDLTAINPLSGAGLAKRNPCHFF